MQTLTVLLALGAFLVVVMVTDVRGELCSYCECPAEFTPVCGFSKRTRKYRGYSSKCLLECSNKCRKDTFEFLGYGRCGKYYKESVTPKIDKEPSTTASPQGKWSWLRF